MKGKAKEEIKEVKQTRGQDKKDLKSASPKKQEIVKVLKEEPKAAPVKSEKLKKKALPPIKAPAKPAKVSPAKK